MNANGSDRREKFLVRGVPVRELGDAELAAEIPVVMQEARAAFVAYDQARQALEQRTSMVNVMLYEQERRARQIAIVPSLPAGLRR